MSSTANPLTASVSPTVLASLLRHCRVCHSRAVCRTQLDHLHVVAVRIDRGGEEAAVPVFQLREPGGTEAVQPGHHRAGIRHVEVEDHPGGLGVPVPHVGPPVDHQVEAAELEDQVPVDVGVVLRVQPGGVPVPQARGIGAGQQDAVHARHDRLDRPGRTNSSGSRDLPDDGRRSAPLVCRRAWLGLPTVPDAVVTDVPPPWTADQVLSLAPDASAQRAARALAGDKAWCEVGLSVEADLPPTVWGLCQGSDRQPYQICVDLTEPAYRCTCPSRKFPCKHTLAMLLRWAAGGVPEALAPAWVREWQASRAGRGARAGERPEGGRNRGAGTGPAARAEGPPPRGRRGAA